MRSSHNSIALISAAGSGKTTHIVDQALSYTGGRILITTYTNPNLEQVRGLLIDRAGYVPEKITVQTWFTFLLRHGVRPYQNQMGDWPRARSIYYGKKSAKFHKKNNYFTGMNDIYDFKVAEFVDECNKKSDGLIGKRLEKIYSKIFVDELQDLAGYDLSVLEMLFRSTISVEVLGDPRQATYSTNNAMKNKQWRGSRIYGWLKEQRRLGLVSIDEHCNSHRCNQELCDFADRLFPELPKTTSSNAVRTGHDGVFSVNRVDIAEYMRAYRPSLLQYNKTAVTSGFPAINIGLTKGKTYDRVLIFPTKSMLGYLASGDPEEKVDKPALYVAITRAKYSAAFVVDDASISSSIPHWNSEGDSKAAQDL